jgi:hypothetical protein
VEFDAPAGLKSVEIFISAGQPGPEAEASLYACKDGNTVLATAHIEPRTTPFLILRPNGGLAAGRYRVRVAVTKGVSHVWLAPAASASTSVKFGETEMKGRGVVGKVVAPDGTETPLVPREYPTTPTPLGEVTSAVLDELEIGAGVGIGEHNNACFVRYPDWFWRKFPDAAMRDLSGRVIGGGGNPWPAMDDPSLTRLAREQMEGMIQLLHDQRWVRYWVLGGEQGYPDYFAGAKGDYRPASRRHYRAWQGLNKLPPKPRFGDDQWNEFRESAVVDRIAGYTAFLRKLDPSRPILIPTHGNPSALDLRPKLGYPVDELAGAADGFESGPIAIDDDAERLVRMTLDQQTSFGVPVAAPRLADKRLDPSARGGGRSFSPSSLRRFLYESLGLGDRKSVV